LRQVPARVRFLSCEPLLGPLRLKLEGIHWVIAGGETGPDFRSMDPIWARSIRDQCAKSGVAFFMKQMANRAAIPKDLLVRDYPRAIKCLIAKRPNNGK
jgi:protein gp37